MLYKYTVLNNYITHLQHSWSSPLYTAHELPRVHFIASVCVINVYFMYFIERCWGFRSTRSSKSATAPDVFVRCTFTCRRGWIYVYRVPRFDQRSCKRVLKMSDANLMRTKYRCAGYEYSLTRRHNTELVMPKRSRKKPIQKGFSRDAPAADVTVIMLMSTP